MTEVSLTMSDGTLLCFSQYDAEEMVLGNEWPEDVYECEMI